MTFVDVVPEDQAEGATAEMYATDEEAFGFLPNFTRAFSHRPAVYSAARCFFSKTLDALGVEPDAKYSGLDSGVRDALTVGRAIATS